MKKNLLYIFAFLPVLLWSQVYHPQDHIQQHTLPRGAYVACVDDMAQEMAEGKRSRLEALESTIRRHQLNFIAFYGLHRVLDNLETDNPRETELRNILIYLRSRFPDLEIGAIGGGRTEPNTGKFGAQHFEQLETGNFSFGVPNDRTCPNHQVGALSFAGLNKVMNPRAIDARSSYVAEVLKFFARIASQYGFAPKLGGSGKSASLDYFDHIVLEDEWWWATGDLRLGLDDHKLILRGMRAILFQSEACHAKVISYENIQEPAERTPTMQEQATELVVLADRIFVTHYFRCVPNTLERYCEVIQAWSKAATPSTEFWPLFSSEDGSAKNHCSRFDPSLSWNDYWGEWMDTTRKANTPPPDLCPGPGRPGFGYPYQASEAEDLYLIRLDSARGAKAMFAGACPSFTAPNYQPKGFMWFIAHLMDPHNRGGISIGENPALPLPEIFPNPASEEIQLSAGHLQKVYNHTGAEVHLRQIAPQQYSLEGLSPGVYLLEVIWENQVSHLKLIKE